MSKLMRAIVVEEYGGPEVMKIKKIPIPNCGRGQVLIRVKAAGVNPVDVYTRDNRYSIHGLNAKLPFTPGWDCGGIVEEVGPGVRNFKVGDRVFTYTSVTGTYAEFALSDSTSVFPIPGEEMSFTQAAGLGMAYLTAYRALFQKFRVNENETVLVHGASGSVGIACIQLLRAFIPSVKILATAGSEKGLKLVKGFGVASVYNHRYPSYVDEIVRDYYPKGVDVIIEMLANENLEKDISRIIGQHGRIAVIGNRGNVSINARALMRKEVIIYGTYLLNATPLEIQTAAGAICSPEAEEFVEPVIDRTFPLEEAGQAHVRIMETVGHCGKVVLEISSD